MVVNADVSGYSLAHDTTDGGKEPSIGRFAQKVMNVATIKIKSAVR